MDRIRVVGIAALFVFVSLASSAVSVEWISFDGSKPGTTPDVEVLQSGEDGVIVHIRVHGIYTGNILADGEVYQWLDIPGWGHVSDVGAPSVPARGFFLEIPYGILPVAHVSESSSTTLGGDYNILPVQEPLPDMNVAGKEAPFVKDQAVYSQNRPFPKDLAQISRPGVIRGHRVAFTGILPVKYNPVLKSVEVFTDLKLKLKYIGPIDREAAARNRRLRSRAFDAVYEGFVLNAGQSEGTAEPAGAESEGSGGADYLVITHDNFYSDAMLLADWKNKKGVMTKVVTLTEIAPSPTATDIENYIQNAYDTWTPAPTYVLLVGDVEYIPTSEISTDLYYSTLQGDDYYPDIFIGRLPVDSSSVGTVVSKILGYDKTPDTSSNWYDDVLIAAYFQDDDDNSYADRFFLQTAEAIYDFLLYTEGYICDTVYTTNSSNPLYYYWGQPIPSGLDFTGITQNIIDSINSGAMLALHRDHGATWGWGDPRFTTSDVNDLANGSKLPVVFSINCLSGSFDDTVDCFCEAILKKDGGGAVGTIGATKLSYSGYNDELAKGFCDAIWPDFDLQYPGVNSINQVSSPVFHLGGILNYGKFAMYDKYVATNGAGYPWGASDSVSKDEFEMFHLLGDPELSIVTRMPQALQVNHPESISLGVNSFSVAISSGFGPVEGARVCVMKGSEVYEVVSTGQNGEASITMEPAPATTGALDITVTCHNYSPYEDTCDIVPPGGPYLVYHSHTIDDGVDGDGSANPNESIVMPVTLQNTGILEGHGISGTIFTDSPYVVINDGTAYFDNIPPGGGTGSSIDPHFSFTISSEVPSGVAVEFILDWEADDLDGNLYEGETGFSVPIVLPFVVDYAQQDIPLSGTVSGSYLDTYESDGNCEEISEVLSGRGSKAYSYLEHKWAINVTGGIRVTFCIMAHRSENTEGDSFSFSYSTDDVTYHDMLIVGSTSDILRTFELPGGTGGTVYIRVVDTDQTIKNKGLDTIYVDELYIKSNTRPNIPPVAHAGGPYSGVQYSDVQFDGSGSYDLNGDPMTYSWNFGDGNTGTGISPSHTYVSDGIFDVTLVVNDGIVDSDVSYTTAEIVVNNDPPDSMHVSKIEMSIDTRTAGKNTFTKAVAAVTVVDGSGNPVGGATVYGQWSGATSDADSGITGSNGIVTLESDEVKSASSGTTFTFTVTDVVLPGWTYEGVNNTGSISVE